LDPITLVLLPGLDGTGTLFTPFIDALPETVTTVSVSYDGINPDSYNAYCDFVVSQLPIDTPYFVLGESFSGPVALLLGSRTPPGCLGLILSCSFASSVTPSFLPGKTVVKNIPISAVPVSAIRVALMNTFKQTAASRALDDVLNSLDADIVTTRLQLILDLDIRDKLPSMELPTLVLRASQDKLVGIRSSQEMVDLLPNAQETVIRGPHFLLQTEPNQCADSVVEFIDEIRSV